MNIFGKKEQTVEIPTQAQMITPSLPPTPVLPSNTPEMLPQRLQVILDFEIENLSQLKNVIQFENDMLFENGVIIVSTKKKI